MAGRFVTMMTIGEFAQWSSLRPPEVRRVVELKQSMIVKAGDAVVNPVCCLKARRRTYMLN